MWFLHASFCRHEKYSAITDGSPESMTMRESNDAGLESPIVSPNAAAAYEAATESIFSTRPLKGRVEKKMLISSENV